MYFTLLFLILLFYVCCFPTPFFFASFYVCSAPSPPPLTTIRLIDFDFRAKKMISRSVFFFSTKRPARAVQTCSSSILPASGYGWTPLLPVHASSASYQLPPRRRGGLALDSSAWEPRSPPPSPNGVRFARSRWRESSSAISLPPLNNLPISLSRRRRRHPHHGQRPPPAL
jgi:hypothetical protein